MELATEWLDLDSPAGQVSAYFARPVPARSPASRCVP
jgi:hypothetical protein